MESQYQDIITETFSTDENIVLGDFGIPGGRLMGVTAFLYIEKMAYKHDTILMRNENLFVLKS